MGNSHNCRNGLELCSALDNTNLIPLNTGEPTYRTRPESPPSIIDLTFVSQNLFNITSWGVWNDSLGSDHFPVVSSLGTAIASCLSHKSNLKRVDWISFSNNLSESIKGKNGTLNSSDIDCLSKYKAFGKSVDEAVTAASPPSRPPKNLTHSKNKRKTFVPAPWWDADSDASIEERRLTLASYRRRRNAVNYMNLNRIEAKTRRTLNAARRNNFRKFCEILDRTTPISRVWRIVQCFKNKYTQPANASCSGDSDTIQKLHSLAEEMLPPTVFFDSFPENFQKKGFLQAPFSEAELSIALTLVKTKSFPGLDNCFSIIFA
ncbi:uncharacterized protein LOC117182938 [Belonocnema kinseyi]|uniref:uncharacterized protein LOC117182938 n=1 Tax=Belonocnema kinseyi TaxID=2817044 RepID=UPI00143DC7C9|nr:uncharacterized protein LOC117182938 [Belonocnema kinseyi]